MIALYMDVLGIDLEPDDLRRYLQIRRRKDQQPVQNCRDPRNARQFAAMLNNPRMNIRIGCKHRAGCEGPDSEGTGNANFFESPSYEE